MRPALACRQAAFTRVVASSGYTSSERRDLSSALSRLLVVVEKYPEFVPLCESLDLKVPAHWDEERQEYVLDYPFPCEYDAAAKHWDFAGGEISWEQVFDRWKKRGPMNERYVESVRRSHGSLDRLLASAA